MRIAIGVALAVGLSGCVQETYYHDGVGFGSYEDYLRAREEREAALANNNISVEQTVLPPVDPSRAPDEVQTAAITPADVAP